MLKWKYLHFPIIPAWNETKPMVSSFLNIVIILLNVIYYNIPMELIEIHRRKLKPGKGIFKGRDNTFTTQTPRQSSILCCNWNLSSRIPLLSLPDEPVQKDHQRQSTKCVHGEAATFLFLFKSVPSKKSLRAYSTQGKLVETRMWDSTSVFKTKPRYRERERAKRFLVLYLGTVNFSCIEKIYTVVKTDIESTFGSLQFPVYHDSKIEEKINLYSFWLQWRETTVKIIS